MFAWWWLAQSMDSWTYILQRERIVCESVYIHTYVYIYIFIHTLLLFSCSVMSNYLLPHGLQHTRLSCPSPSPGACSNSCPLISDAIQPSRPLLFPSPSAFNLSHLQGVFRWVDSSRQVTRVLELQLQHQSFRWKFRVDFLWDWLVWSPCSPRDSQESSPIPQFQIISSSVLSLFLWCSRCKCNLNIE